MKFFTTKFPGIASFAQERIFLDEKVRFSSKVAIYNELTVLRVVQGSLSTNRLLRALRYILNKHKILRTSLIFNNDDGTLKQCITDMHQTFTLATEKIFRNQNELQDTIYQTTIDPHLFDLSNGRVFHCQILRQQKLVNENNDNKLITESDVLIIAFHHAATDRTCHQIFYNDLCMAYNNDMVMSPNEEALQYIDYAVHERLMDMTPSRDFWHSQLKGYNLERSLSLPVDRHRSSTDQRSGSASLAEISFNNDISTEFLNYASSHQVTPFQLGLATFYAFLLKLTHSENDLCISCLHANRYKTELRNMIGMFVAILPYRIHLDPYWSFDELVKHVREKCLSILEHSHYPLQHILADCHLKRSNIEFLETAFDFIIIPSNIDQSSLDGASLKEELSEQSSEVSKFDFLLSFVYNPTSDDSRLSCRFTCSCDLFDKTTVTNIARRFRHLFFQLFSSHAGGRQSDSCLVPVCKLNLIIPEEVKEMASFIFYRQSHIVDEGMCIYLFIYL
jgi:hypothetical protein